MGRPSIQHYNMTKLRLILVLVVISMMTVSVSSRQEVIFPDNKVFNLNTANRQKPVVSSVEFPGENAMGGELLGRTRTGAGSSARTGAGSSTRTGAGSRTKAGAGSRLGLYLRTGHHEYR